MGLVDHQEGVMPVGDRNQVCERREIAIHAVEALDHDPDPPGAALRPPFADRGFDRLGIVMPAFAKFGTAGARALVNARMHELIENEQITPLGQRCQDGEIGDISAGEKNRRFRAEEAGRLGLEAFVLLAVAAQ
jgi:hypothetical protein